MADFISKITEKNLTFGSVTAGDIARNDVERLAHENEVDMSIQSFSAVPTLDPLRTSGNVQFAPFIGSANAAAPETPGANRTILGEFFDIFSSPLRNLGTPGFTPGDDPGLIPVEGIVIGDPDFEGPNAIQGPGDIRRARNLQIATFVLLGLGVFMAVRILR